MAHKTVETVIKNPADKKEYSSEFEFIIDLATALLDATTARMRQIPKEFSDNDKLRLQQELHLGKLDDVRSHLENTIKQLQQHSVGALCESGQYETRSVTRETWTEPCGYALGYNSCDCSRGGRCTGGGHSEVERWQAEETVPIMVPDVNRMAQATQALPKAHQDLEAYNNKYAPICVNLKNSIQQLEAANTKLSIERQNLVQFEKFLNDLMMRDDINAMKQIYINHELFSRLYSIMDDGLQMLLLNLIFSLRPSEKTLSLFSATLSRVDFQAMDALPLVLYGMPGLGYKYSQENMYRAVLTLLQTEEHKDKQTLRNRVYLHYVNYTVLQLVKHEIENLQKFYNIFMLSADEKINLLQRLNSLLENQQYRQQEMGEQSKSTYRDVINFWKNELVSSNDSGKKVTTDVIINSERNPFKQLGIFEKANSHTHDLIDKIIDDFGSAELSSMG